MIRPWLGNVIGGEQPVPSGERSCRASSERSWQRRAARAGPLKKTGVPRSHRLGLLPSPPSNPSETHYLFGARLCIMCFVEIRSADRQQSRFKLDRTLVVRG